jgi:hypothetical protein
MSAGAVVVMGQKVAVGRVWLAEGGRFGQRAEVAGRGPIKNAALNPKPQSRITTNEPRILTDALQL